jgi:hypothetical protein
VKRTKKHKGKGKVVPKTEHHSMNAYWGNGGIAPRILVSGQPLHPQ